MEAKKKSYKFLLFSEHYIFMVTNTLEKMIEADNPYIISSDTEITDADRGSGFELSVFNKYIP